MPTHFSSTRMRLKVASTGNNRPSPWTASSSWMPPVCARAASEPPCWPGNSSRTCAPITFGAGTPKIRSAARLYDRTRPSAPKVTIASKLLSTSWRIMPSLAGKAPIWPTRARAWYSTRPSVAVPNASTRPIEPGAGIERDGAERLEADRRQGDQQHRAGEQQERPPPGQSAENRADHQDQKSGAERHRPAPESAAARAPARWSRRPAPERKGQAAPDSAAR